MEDEKLEEIEATTESGRQQKCLWNGKHRLNPKTPKPQEVVIDIDIDKWNSFNF